MDIDFSENFSGSDVAGFNIGVTYASSRFPIFQMNEVHRNIRKGSLTSGKIKK